MTILFKEVQEFRKILCVCPCCGELVRVSDLHLKVKGPTPKTWLDDYEKKCQMLKKKEDKFQEGEGKLREKAHEKGRKEAQKVFNNAISPTFRALKYDPFDVKPILNPVDFVVFNGMNKNESVSEVIMLSKKCIHPQLNLIRKQVKTAIAKNRYNWQVARIDEKGCISFE